MNGALSCGLLLHSAAVTPLLEKACSKNPRPGATGARGKGSQERRSCRAIKGSGGLRAPGPSEPSPRSSFHAPARDPGLCSLRVDVSGTLTWPMSFFFSSCLTSSPDDDRVSLVLVTGFHHGNFTIPSEAFSRQCYPKGMHE